RHLMFVGIGVAAAIVAAVIPARFWRQLAPWLFWGTFAMLILVLVPVIGATVNGAQRWFRHGSLSGQPSELMKIALPLFVCSLAVRRRDVLHTWVRGTLPVVFPLLIVVPAVMVEPDLGTALFLGCVGAAALFVSGWPIRNFVLAG